MHEDAVRRGSIQVSAGVLPVPACRYACGMVDTAEDQFIV